MGKTTLTVTSFSFGGFTYKRLCLFEEERPGLLGSTVWGPFLSSEYFRVSTFSWGIRSRISVHSCGHEYFVPTTSKCLKSHRRIAISDHRQARVHSNYNANKSNNALYSVTFFSGNIKLLSLIAWLILVHRSALFHHQSPLDLEPFTLQTHATQTWYLECQTNFWIKL